MLFNSLLFLVFFPTVVIVYFLLPHRYRWIFLLLASYYFYMNWKPAYGLLLFFSTVVNWIGGILVETASQKSRKKFYLASTLVINFSLLFFYKYFNFLNAAVHDLLGAVNIRWQVPNLEVLLPVGISFFTFQAVAYMVDIYRGTIKAERHFGIYALFHSFFPQLVAGPIERATNLLPQFREVKRLTIANLAEGFKIMLWGYFLKVVLADRLAIYVDAVYNNVENHNGTSYALATFLFAFQIYGDFAGYSLIAIGAARAMDFRLMTNFQRPYLAANVTTFWSRWHISLSTWFKDYLYIPLGGNRRSAARNYLNVFTTFFVSGIWHGANFTFMLWGTLHGMFLVIERMLGLAKINQSQKFGIATFFRITLTFVLVDFAWIFFRANNLGDAKLIVSGLFNDFGAMPFVKWEVFFAASLALLIVFIREVKEEFFPGKLSLIRSTNPAVRLGSMAALTALILLFGVFDAGQFIYFQF